MLTEKEQLGVKAILDKLHTDDLYSLTFTVTKGLIKPENIHEAIQAVLLYCEKPSLLLRRKKVKKEIIFNYLRDNGVTVSVNGEKSNYIKACLQFWESLENNQLELMDDYVDETISITEYSPPSTIKNVTPDIPVYEPYATYCALNPKEVVALGQQFVNWFYKLLNESSLGKTVSQEYKKQAFTDDCSMSWLVKDAERVFSSTVCTANEAVQVITEMIVCNLLVLNPGLEGVLSSYDPHGIVKIKVGGVVYRMNNSIGIFEQVFGLFRDPMQANTWKIKKTHLKMEVNFSFAKSLEQR